MGDTSKRRPEGKGKNVPAFPAQQTSSTVVALQKEMEFDSKDKARRKAKKSKSKKKEASSTYKTSIHVMELEDIYKKHDVDPDKGLSSQQIAQLREKWGPNCLTPPPTL